MRIRKLGVKYKACEKKREKRISILKELCRVNYKITNLQLIIRLDISKSEFYRNYKELADRCRAVNKCESLF